MSAEFDRFRAHLHEVIDDCEAVALKRFKEVVGALFSDAIDRATDSKKGIVGPAKQSFIKTAFTLCHTKVPKDLASYVTNLSRGKGDDERTFALYYLCYLTQELHEQADVAFGILCADRDATFQSVADEALGPRYTLHEIISGKLLDELRTDPFAPVLTLPTSASTTHFTNTTVKILGREAEQEKLRRFLTGKGFRWLQLAGVGGQGKSRLAYDLTREFAGLWDTGFLLGENLELFAADERYKKWMPHKSTLIVIDYVVGQYDSIGPILQTFAGRSTEFEELETPVRLLLVERQRWDRGGFRKPDTRSVERMTEMKLQIDEGYADWFVKLSTSRLGDDKTIHDTKFENGVVELEKLERPDLIKIVHDVEAEQIVNGSGKTISQTDDEIAEILKRIDSAGRPLYAYFLAFSLADGSYRSGWGQDELLRQTISREQMRRWKGEFGENLPDLSDDTLGIRLAVLTTITGEIDIIAAREKLQDWGTIDKQVVREALVLTDGPIRGGVEGVGTLVVALEPDVLGEWFALTCFTNFTPIAEIMQVAWKINPKGTASFIQRCAQDFARKPVVMDLLDVDPGEGEGLDAYASVAGNIVGAMWTEETEQYPKLLIEALERGVEFENPMAMGSAAYCYHAGINFEENQKAAFELWLKAAEKKNVGSMRNVGVCYALGNGVTRKPIEAVNWWRKAADAGNSSAMFDLGQAYDTGNGTEKNLVEALGWWRKAADAGNSSAMFTLGWAYDTGNGIEKNRVEALGWWRKASNAGSSVAMCNLGVAYYNGDGVESDYVQAVAWYRKAATAGDGTAMFNLGRCYQNGLGVESDIRQAIALYSSAAKKKNISAIKSLANICINNLCKNELKDEIITTLNIEALACNVTAMFELSAIYEHSDSSTKDYVCAERWIVSAAEHGDRDAMFNLGVKYFQGTYGKIDIEKSIYWYEAAAALGDRKAMFLLGDIHEKGYEVRLDIDKAMNWYRKSADLGNPESMLCLGNLFLLGNHFEKDESEAYVWYKKAANINHKLGLAYVGICLQQGFGVKINLFESLSYFQKAADNGSNGGTGKMFLRRHWNRRKS